MTRLGFSTALLALFALSRPAVADSSPTVPFYPRESLTASQLKGRSLRELELMRSTILARAGQVFAPWWLRLAFSGQPWYQPTGLDERRLSQLDRANLKTLDRYQRQLPRTELESRLKALVDRHGHAFEQNPDKVALSRDGQRILACYPEGQVMLWDARSGRLVHRLEVGRGYRPAVDTNAAVDFSPDGKMALAATGGKVFAWDASNGKLVKSFSPGIASDETEIQGGAFTPDGERALIINWRGRLSLWDVTSGARLGGIEKESKYVSVAFLPDGKSALLWGHGGIDLLDTATWKIEARMLPDQGVSALVLSPRGDQGSLWRWGVETSFGSLFNPKTGDPGPLQRISGRVSAFSPDGKRLYVGEESARITVWDLASRQSRQLRGPAMRETVTFHPEGIEQQSHESVFDVDTVFVANVGRSPEWLHQLAVFPDGKRLIAVGASLAMIDTDDGQPVGDWRGHEPWTLDDATEVVLLSRKLGVEIDSRWPTQHLRERSPLEEPALFDNVLSKYQLAGMGRMQLWVARGAIYARRGRPFQSAPLRSLFVGLPWYKPDPAFSEKRLTSVDRKNLRNIAAEERAQGGRLSQKQFVKMWEGLDAELHP